MKIMLKHFASEGGISSLQHSSSVDTLPHQPLAQLSRKANLDAAQPAQVVGRVKSLRHIPSDSTVLIRAFDLAAIEVAFRLSEGRGGVFKAGALIPKYCRSGLEPFRVDIRNASGRPMLAKPTGDIKLAGNSFWVPYRERLNALKSKPGQMSFRHHLWPIFLQAVAELLTQAGTSSKPTDVEDWYRGWSRYQLDAVSARRAMLQSLGVATGLRRVDIPFAVGETWRNLSSQVEELVRVGGAGNEQDMYAAVREEMQRIAFGPSAIATAKLLSLLRARVVTIGPLGEIGS